VEGGATWFRLLFDIIKNQKLGAYARIHASPCHKMRIKTATQ
jgi:hypothetical protein